MPKIIEYNPSSPKLNPNDRALQAWETAGRRVGPLYNQAAQDIKQAGAVKGEMEKAKIWPFDIYALEASGAPQIHNTTNTETRASKSNEGFVSGFAISESRGDGTGLLVGNGTSQGADYTEQYANAGYSTTPESAANASNDWMYNHGEASAGAVGMSRMARAAAAGHGGLVHGGSVDPKSGNTFMGGPDDLIDPASGNIIGKDPKAQEQEAERAFRDFHRARAERDYQENRAYTQAQRQQAINDRYQRGVDKWNREQAAADKADWMRFNGPNGFNTRRDEWIDGKGGLNDQWQQDYNRDLITQEKAVAAAKKADPSADEGVLRQNIYNKMNVTPPVQSTYGSYTDDNPQYRERYMTGETFGQSVSQVPRTLWNAYQPSNIIGAAKSALGSMFGSTLQDDDNTAGEEEEI